MGSDLIFLVLCGLSVLLLLSFFFFGLTFSSSPPLDEDETSESFDLGFLEEEADVVALTGWSVLARAWRLVMILSKETRSVLEGVIVL